MTVHFTPCFRLVARIICAVLLAGPAVILISNEVTAISSKPKEIVVVGSKIDGDSASIRWNFTYQQGQSGVDHAAGHFWFLSPDHDEHSGPIIIGRLLHGEDICGGMTFEGTMSIPRGQQEGFVMLQLVFALTPTESSSCGTERRANGRQVAVQYTGGFTFEVAITSPDESTIRVGATGHGHLDYLKQVHDPA